MDDGIGAAGAMLPIYVQLPLTMLLILFLAGGLRFADSLPARFLVFAIWVRFILSNYHAWTYPKLVAGLSINALSSVALVGLGLIVIRRQSLLSKGIAPLYLLFIVVLLSAGLNDRYGAGIDVLVKYAFLLVLAIAVSEALGLSDRRRFAIALLFAFSPLIIFQLASIALGTAKANEFDGTPSFIGGYNHEAVFSVALLAMFVAAALAHRLGGRLRWSAMILALAALALANYRTAILAALPLLGYYLLRILTRRFELRIRPFVVAICLVVVAGAASTAILSSERFADLRLIAQGERTIIQPPDQFTDEDRNLLTGRAKIWSGYIYAWRESGPVEHMVGFGPNAWVGVFSLYAHNSFIDYLYEYGLVGLTALLLVMGFGLFMAFAGDPARRGRLVAAHVGFILLNLATMPFWQIEGLILYALIWGYTMHSYFSPRMAEGGPDGWRSDPASDPR